MVHCHIWDWTVTLDPICFCTSAQNALFFLLRVIKTVSIARIPLLIGIVWCILPPKIKQLDLISTIHNVIHMAGLARTASGGGGRGPCRALHCLLSQSTKWVKILQNDKKVKHPSVPKNHLLCGIKGLSIDLIQRASDKVRRDTSAKKWKAKIVNWIINTSSFVTRKPRH
jgi:hypothetical protein